MLKIGLHLLIFCLPLYLSAQELPTYYIKNSKSGNPTMPNMDFNIPNGSRLILKSVSEHAKRGNKDNIELKSPNTFGVWDVNGQLKNKIFGGLVTISSQSGSVLKKFKIRGQNPNDADVRKFVAENCKEHWYAYAIGKHESRQRFFVFNQFNSNYYKEKFRGLPNCGLPDGWGIMQIDSKRGSQITTEEVYNWRRNVLSGIAVMDKARSEAKGYFNAVKRTFPDKWEEPPAYLYVSKTRLSYLDLCVIQLYNGASVVRRLKTAFGTYSYYRSAFVFDENADSGKRWTFKPNVNNYVNKVVTHEIEGGIKSENEVYK